MSVTPLPREQQPSAAAVAAFGRALPKLVLFVNDKIGIDDRFMQEGFRSFRVDALESFNRTFGELLQALFEFGLYDCFEQECRDSLTELASRGVAREPLESLIKAWIMGIQCTLGGPETARIVAPLEWLRHNLPELLERPDASVPLQDGNMQRFVRYLLDKNRKFAAESLLAMMREGASIERIYTGVLLPALEHVRTLVRTNRLCIADDRSAADIGRYVMFRVIDSVFGERRYPFKVLVACMPQEKQTLTAEIFASYLEIKGWSVLFAGSGGSRNEIGHAVAASSPQIVVISAASLASLPEAASLARHLRNTAQEVKIVMEGRAAVSARAGLEPLADALVTGFEQGHNVMLDLVMPHA